MSSHVFISYVGDDREEVTRLAVELDRLGLMHWFDSKDIRPGHDWDDEIRKGIREADYFIACFSDSYHKRDDTFMSREIEYAKEHWRGKKHERDWFIPVRLSDCKLPNIRVYEGERGMIEDIQWIDLFKDWASGIDKLARKLGKSYTILKRWALSLCFLMMSASLAAEWYWMFSDGSPVSAYKILFEPETLATKAIICILFASGYMSLTWRLLAGFLL